MDKGEGKVGTSWEFPNSLGCDCDECVPLWTSMTCLKRNREEAIKGALDG